MTIINILDYFIQQQHNTNAQVNIQQDNLSPGYKHIFENEKNGDHRKSTYWPQENLTIGR